MPAVLASASGNLDGGRSEDGHHGVVAGAVVAALELEDFLLAGVGAGGAHGLEAGVGAAGGEAHLLGAGDGLDQFLGEENGLVVGGKEGGAATDGGQHGLTDRRVGVAEDHGAGTHQPVHVLVAGHVPDATAPTLADEELELVGVVGVAGAASGQVLGRFLQ